MVGEFSDVGPRGSLGDGSKSVSLIGEVFLASIEGASYGSSTGWSS